MIRSLWQTGQRLVDGSLDDRVQGLVSVVDEAEVLCAQDAAVVKHAIVLALSPGKMQADHLERLRAHGLSDPEIHDVTHVVCCFSYMNRLADGLGVSMLDERRDVAIDLLGEAELIAHETWSSG